MGQLRLSNELIEQVQQVIAQQDEQARDPVVGLQYLAAIMGYLLGAQNAEADEKREFHEQLCGFSRNVLEDVLSKQEAPAPQEAFGIWRPEK
jgi:hypothetical protein